MSLTTADRKALYDSSTSRVLLDFVTISSANMPATLYLVANGEAVTVGANTHLPVSMKVKNPDKGTLTASGTLQISGVTLEYIEILQNLDTEEQISVETFSAFADNPTSPIDGPYTTSVKNVTITSSSGMIELSLTVDSPLDHYAGVKRYTPSYTPAIYV